MLTNLSRLQLAFNTVPVIELPSSNHEIYKLINLLSEARLVAGNIRSQPILRHKGKAVNTFSPG